MVRFRPGGRGVKFVRHRFFLRVGAGPFRAQPALGIRLGLGKPVGALMRELQREIVVDGDDDIAVVLGYFECFEVRDGVVISWANNDGPVRIGLANDRKCFLDIGIPDLVRQIPLWLIEKLEQQDVGILLVMLSNLLPKSAELFFLAVGVGVGLVKVMNVQISPAGCAKVNC